MAKPRSSGGNGLLWEKKPDPETIHWANIGHARSAVTLAALDVPGEGAQLFCSSWDGTLWRRDLAVREAPWRPIATGCGATTLAAVNVPGEGPKLFGATQDNLIYSRDAVAADAPWLLVGEAGGVVALAALDLPGDGARLYCVTEDSLLFEREATASGPWQVIGDAAGATGLAALDVPGEGPQLFCATRDDRLYRRDARKQGGCWEPIGKARNVIAMAAAGDRLVCLTPGEEFKLTPLPHQVYLPVLKQVQIAAWVRADSPRRITVTDEFGNCLGSWAGVGERQIGALAFRVEQGSTPGVLVVNVMCERQYDGDPNWYGSRCTVSHKRGKPGTPEEMTVTAEDCWVSFRWRCQPACGYARLRLARLAQAGQAGSLTILAHHAKMATLLLRRWRAAASRARRS